MVRSRVRCCAYNCKSSSSMPGISFHSFPKDPKLSKKWCDRLRWKDFTASKSTRICSEHFENDCFLVNFGLKTIRKGSLPSIFNFKTTTETKRSRRVLVRNTEANDKNAAEILTNGSSTVAHQQSKDGTLVCENGTNSVDGPTANASSTVKNHHLKDEALFCQCVKSTEETEKRDQMRKRKEYIGDYDIKDMESVELAKDFFIRAKLQLNKKNQVVRSVRQLNGRLSKKVRRLTSLLERYEKRGLWGESLKDDISDDNISEVHSDDVLFEIHRSNNVRQLKATAVPSIFDKGPNPQPVRKPSCAKKRKVSSGNSEDEDATCDSLPETASAVNNFEVQKKNEENILPD